MYFMNNGMMRGLFCVEAHYPDFFHKCENESRQIVKKSAAEGSKETLL